MEKNNNIPKGWKEYRLLDICEVYQPPTIATKNFVENGKYSVYGANGEIGKLDRFNHEEPQVLMACRGASCGAINVSKSFSWINGNAMVVKPNNKVYLSKDFLKYNLLSINKASIITGTAQPQITRQNLKDFKILVCDSTEQSAIVSRIESSFSRLDSGIATLQKVQKQLAVYRQAVLKEAFEGCGEVDYLGNVLLSIESGKSFKCVETPPKANEYGIIKVSAVTWGVYNEQESKTCKPEQFIESKRIKENDFLFSRANTLELIGNCVIAKGISKNLMLSDKILRFIISDNINKEFLLYYLRSGFAKKQIRNLSTGNQDGMRNIGQERIRKIIYPKVSLAEQNRIVEQIESRLSVCDSIEKTVTESLRQAEVLRQSILKEAFEGKWGK